MNTQHTRTTPHQRPFTRALRFATAAVVLSAALLAPLAPTALRAAPSAASPAAATDLPSNIFDPNEVGWASVRNMTSAQYADYFDAKSAQGYMVTDIEVDIVDGIQRVGAVWQRNLDNRGWYQLRNLTNDEFHAKWTEYADAGYRLIDQESYVMGETRYYAGVWVENKEGLGWASLRNLTSEEFSVKFDEYSRDGLMLIDVEAYPIGDGSSLRYAMAWVENSENLGWAEYRNMTSAEFSEKFDEYAEAGYRMIDVESYIRNGVQNYAGIWVQNKNGRGWYEFRDMTSQQFGNKWQELRDAGYRLIDYETYPTASGWRYAGIWRQNGERADWPLKERVTSLVQAQYDDFDIPGMSVAIAVEGRFVYLRGFGYADIDDGITANSRTVYPLASIAKAVGGVLAFELDELNLLDIDLPTSAYVAGMPAHHLLHTVRQTINNRSGIGHYSSYSGQGFAPPYDTALDAVEDVDHVPLAYATGTYTYSTFAYNWLGASIEDATEMNVRAALDTYLRVPYNLNTLRAMHGAPADPFRATGYNSSNAEIAPHETSHKVLGGGIEASAYDLARMGIKLIDGQILSAASLNDMWTPPDNQSSYAEGWSTNTTDAGTPIVAKDGAQSGARSYIRMYPEEEIVIVVLTNRKNGGHSPVQLGRDIGALLLANLSAAAAGAPVDAAAAAAAPPPVEMAPPALQRLAAGDFDEPQAEATDPALLIFPAVAAPAPPDPFDGEPEDEEVIVFDGQSLYLPLVNR